MAETHVISALVGARRGSSSLTGPDPRHEATPAPSSESQYSGGFVFGNLGLHKPQKALTIVLSVRQIVFQLADKFGFGHSKEVREASLTRTAQRELWGAPSKSEAPFFMRPAPFKLFPPFLRRGVSALLTCTEQCASMILPTGRSVAAPKGAGKRRLPAKRLFFWL